MDSDCKLCTSNEVVGVIDLLHFKLIEMRLLSFSNTHLHLSHVESFEFFQYLDVHSSGKMVFYL